MDAANFKSKWEVDGETLRPFPGDWLSAANLPSDAKDFLQLAGLPDDAAPFLSFRPDNLGWLSSDDPSLDQFSVIGSDGAGNPIIVDRDGAVWLLDHERLPARHYINRSLETLADSLLAYRTLVANAQTLSGDDAFLNGNIPEDLIDDFATAVRDADPASLQPGALWAIELDNLKANSNA